MTRETSLAVYNQIQRDGLLSEKRLRIAKIFADNGVLTGSQVAQLYKQAYPTNNHSETIRNRITELVGMKVLEEVGTGTCPFSQREVLRFQFAGKLPEKLVKPSTKKQKVKLLIDKIDQGLLLVPADLFGQQFTIMLEEIKSELNEI